MTNSTVDVATTIAMIAATTATIIATIASKKSSATPVWMTPTTIMELNKRWAERVTVSTCKLCMKHSHGRKASIANVVTKNGSVWHLFPHPLQQIVTNWQFQPTTVKTSLVNPFFRRDMFAASSSTFLKHKVAEILERSRINFHLFCLVDEVLVKKFTVKVRRELRFSRKIRSERFPITLFLPLKLRSFS